MRNLDTLKPMTATLFHGSTERELRSIKQIIGVAMDGPHAANSGHSGTAMALAPLGVTLFSRILRHDPSRPDWIDRDRFILSCGHASILQYALAHTFGYDLSAGDLESFRAPHSRTPGHPEVGVTPTVEVTTGPLGQGLANGVGMAMAERVLSSTYGEDLVAHRTWVIAGDGCLEEGISHEAASLAGRLQLGRLTVIYDDNHITIDGATELALSDDTPARFRAYGWHVVEAGEVATDLDAMEEACREAMRSDRPTLIILRSHIGFPSSSMVDTREAHGSPFSVEAIREVKAQLGLPDSEFFLDSDLPEEWRTELQAREDSYSAWVQRADLSGHRAVDLTEQMRTNGATKSSSSVEEYPAGKGVATRKALQHALDAVGVGAISLVSGSADLTDNTGVILPGTQAHSPVAPDGRQVHYGVREFAMGAAMVGMALHGGIRPIGSTFFVFSDYVRPAIRLAALSHAATLFVFTHDSVGVGEDGPTHQPIEHLMSLRAMPNLHVVRPSDANETVRIVASLLSDQEMPPTTLILTRQDVPVLTGTEAEASKIGAKNGAYVLRENKDAVYTIVSTGSEVSLALEASDRLRNDHALATRVVAMPCWACFDSMPNNYKAAVLQRSIPSVAIEAGATLGWYRYVDDAIGIDSFGISAPAGAVFDHFGITASAVVDHVVRSLKEPA